MFESAKIVNYLDELEKLFEDAKNNKKEYVEIVAGDLHKSLSEKPTLPTCCMAMKKVMRENDKIIKDGKNKSGYSSKLKIRYYIKDRESKEFLNKPKKRGRKQNTEKVKKIKNTKKVLTVQSAVKSYLEEMKLNYEENENIFVVYGEYGKWLISCDHVQRGRKLNFSSKLINFLNIYSTEFEKCSYAMIADPIAESEWKHISSDVKQRLNITLLKVTPSGRIKEIL